MQKVKYLIIGAGISGLSFAVQKANEDYLILEKDEVPGGLCRSFFDSGFVWDVAGHFFHFHSQETKAQYEELMVGREQRTVSKCAKVYYKDKYIDAPFQYNIHQLSTEEFMQCLTDLYFANEPTDSASFDDYVRTKYGAGISEKFLIPYNEKLYACKMDDLDKDSMGVFLPKLDFSALMHMYRGRSGSTYNDTFRYPVKGCQENIDALLSKLDNDRIHFSEPVVKVDLQNKIAYTEKAEYRYDYLINTSPLVSFLKMADYEIPVPMNYNKVLVLNIGFDKPSVDKKVSWIYFPGDEIFYRIGFYNNIAGTERLSIYVEIGYAPNERIDVESALQKTLEDLKKVGVTNEHQVVAYNSYIIDPGYAHITTEGKAFTEKAIKDLTSYGVRMIGRYAQWQYSAMDDSMEQALECASLI